VVAGQGPDTLRARSRTSVAGHDNRFSQVISWGSGPCDGMTAGGFAQGKPCLTVSTK
jgi:hypothetical protein